MAPSTVTETIEQFYETSKEIQLTQQANGTKKTSNTIYANTKKQVLSITPYDEALNRSKDSKYLKWIRDWERSVGFVTPILWSNTIFFIVIHLLFIMLFKQIVIDSFNWQTFVFAIFMGHVGGFGVTGGAHRYWCHRSYKAKWPLQIILLGCYSVSGQNTIYEWVRDHRVHHKFSETTADPHDANRGFWFSHIGWLMMKKHPDVIREGNKIDMSDIENDELVKFHTRYHTLFRILFCFTLPSLIPLAWGESLKVAVISQALLRFVITLNSTWSVNSFAHLWGNKPFDRHIMPSENLGVSFMSMGEGWHNYHHTFPWDYKASELGMPFNTTTVLLDLFARIGWAYDLKAASSSLVREVAKNRGDGCCEKLA